jgi:transposase InsO family protein
VLEEAEETRGKTMSLNVVGAGLLLYHATAGLGDRKAKTKVLLDSGASNVFCSEQTARALSPECRIPSIKPRSVDLPNGEVMIAQSCYKVPLRIGTWTGVVDAWVLKDLGYDIILGRNWLSEYNPCINWVTGIAVIRGRHGQHHRLVPVDNHRQIVGDKSALNYIMTPSQTQRAARDKRTKMILWVLRESSEEKKHSDDATPALSKRKSARVDAILSKFKDLFRSELPPEMPPERGHVHDIETNDATPINVNAYPLSKAHEDELKKQLKELVAKGIVRPSSSPWGFPVIFVKKPGGAWRMCIDYRGLNKVTVKNGYPLPRIDGLLDQIGSAKYLSKVDLLSGYWQVRVGELSVPKTAFNTIFGKFEFLAMPFGLTNAPATFQAMMNKALSPYLTEFCVVYLDDILIFSNSLEEHCEHLEKVLSVLREQKLYAKPSKCVFAVEELEFCGHIVGNGKVRPMPEKLEVIKSWPKLRNVHDVRQFLGLATYYRRFVRGFARISAPLSDLLKETDVELRKNKFRPVIWNVACELAFGDLKTALTSEPVVAQPVRDKPFRIETDASEWAIGYVLLQLGADGHLHPVAFDGRKLQGAELNYPTQEKELLAIKEALRTWNRYIDNGTTTTVVTDHESLQYLASTKRYSKRLARWIAEFQEYDLQIRYRKGSEAVVPDAISRRPDFIGEGPANVAQFPFSLSAIALGDTPKWDEVFSMELNALHGLSEEEWLPAMQQFLLDGTPPEDQRMDREIRSTAKQFRLRTDEVEPQVGEENTKVKRPKEVEYRLIRVYEDTEAPYLEPPFRKDLVRRTHEQFGHLGFPGLLGTLKSRAWWPSMREDIQDAMKACPNCQVSQYSQYSLERERQHHQVQQGIRPFERWGIDLIGLLPKTPNGNRWLITAIDYATGWPVAKAVPDATEEAIAEFLHEIYVNYGAPREILSDNGTNLLSGAVKHYVRMLKARHRTTTPYHPRTNGKVENLNGTLGKMLTKYLMGKPTRLWDEYVPQALFATRVRLHSTTKMSPFYLVYGVYPRLPDDNSDDNKAEVVANEGTDNEIAVKEGADELLLNRIGQVNHARSLANELLLNRAIKTAQIRDDAVRKSSFEVGSWVLIRHEDPQKFESRWFGPYRVLKAHPLGTYALQEPGGRVLKNLVNGARLVQAHVDEPEKLWSSRRATKALKRSGQKIERPIEVRKILEESDEAAVPSYNELSTISRTEWERREEAGWKAEAAAGDDTIAQRVLDKRRREKTKATVSDQPRRRGRPPRKKDSDSESESTISVSEHSTEPSDEEVLSEAESLHTVDNNRDADLQSSLPKDAPFAVVVPAPTSREIGSIGRRTSKRLSVRFDQGG